MEKIIEIKKIYQVIPILINVGKYLLISADVSRYQQIYANIGKY